MRADVRDSLIVKSFAFVNSCIQKVSVFIRYFSRIFNCRVMPVSSQFFTMRNYRQCIFSTQGLVFQGSVFLSLPTTGMLPKATAIFVPIGAPCV